MYIEHAKYLILKPRAWHLELHIVRHSTHTSVGCIVELYYYDDFWAVRFLVAFQMIECTNFHAQNYVIILTAAPWLHSKVIHKFYANKSIN